MWVWIWIFCGYAGSVDFKNEGKWIVDETMFWILRTYIRLRHRSFAEKVVHDVWNPISINPEYCGYISVYTAGWCCQNLRNPTVLTVGVCQIYTPTIPETDENGNHYILSEEAILPEIYTCTKCGHSYTEELAKLPSQTNQADQTNQIEPANNGNEKDFIGTVTSVFLNVTDLAAKNFRISFWLMIQMLLKAVMQLW